MSASMCASAASLLAPEAVSRSPYQDALQGAHSEHGVAGGQQRPHPKRGSPGLDPDDYLRVVGVIVRLLLTGPDPVDRGPRGAVNTSCLPTGCPSVAAVSAAIVDDGQAQAVAGGVLAIRSRHGPRRRRPVKVRVDKSYHSTDIWPVCTVAGSRRASPLTA